MARSRLAELTHVGTAVFGCPLGKAQLALSRLQRGSKGIHKRLLPQPRIVYPFLDQPSSNRVLQEIRNLRIKTLRGTDHVIERLWLPNPALTPQLFVNSMGRKPLDRIHDLGERINLHGPLVDQRREDHMNMIGHHDRDPQVDSLPVMMQTALQHDRTHTLRKHPAPISAERDEMLFVITLKMRKLSTIKSLRHKVVCGDSRPRLSAERSSAPLEV